MSSFLGNNTKNEPEVTAEMMKMQIFEQEHMVFLVAGQRLIGTRVKKSINVFVQAKDLGVVI